MNYMKQFIGLGILSLAFSTAYSNEAKPNKTEPVPEEKVIEIKAPDNNTVKIALLLDTSNSMDGLINQAKAQLWDIVNKFSTAKCGNEARPNLQIALYQYGNDRLSSGEGYIQQVLGFSDDLDEISEKLFSLTTNGGEEYCGQVIQTSLRQLDWGGDPDNLKMIFIAGNEPFTQGRLNYKDAITNAKEKDVIVNTIFCGHYEQGIQTEWKNGATLTGGEYLAIDHNRKVVHIKTPYDDIIIKLNSRLNKTYVSYGAEGVSKRMSQALQDNNAMEMEEAVAVKRAVSKSSNLYKNSKWDLVDAVEDEVVNLDQLDKKNLPNELQGKSTAEIEAHIKVKKQERDKIQQEIQEINKNREIYIAQNEKEHSTGELENAMLKAIMKQAAAKGISW